MEMHYDASSDKEMDLLIDDSFQKCMEETKIKDKYVDLFAFVNELLDVCRKYELNDYFETYIAEFIKDMKGYGLVVNTKC